jgi:hypothetical protein
MLSRRFGVPLAVRLSSGLFVLIQPLVSPLPGLSVLSWRWRRSPGCFGAPPALQGEAVSRGFQCSSNLAGDGSLGWLLGCFGASPVLFLGFCCVCGLAGCSVLLLPSSSCWGVKRALRWPSSLVGSSGMGSGVVTRVFWCFCSFGDGLLHLKNANWYASGPSV